MELIHPHLTKSLATELTGRLEKFTHLNEVTITNPQDVVELPHLMFLHRLKISGLPAICDDWLWMTDMQQLQGLEIHVRDANITTTEEEEAANDSSKLLIHHQKTDITINGVDSAKLICQVLKCLPSHFRDEVSSSCTHDKTVQTRESCFLKLMRNIVHYLVGFFRAYIFFQSPH